MIFQIIIRVLIFYPEYCEHYPMSVHQEWFFIDKERGHDTSKIR